MRLLITTSGSDLDAPLDRRFGRAARFLVYDTETATTTVTDNGQNLNAAQGAGIQAAQTAAAAGAEAVITGHCGPKAFRLLRQGGIAVYHTDAATVREAVDQFQAGQLAPSAEADVEGHWV